MIESKAVPYKAGELSMMGTLYTSNAPAHAAIVIFPEAPGPGQNVHSRAERLAQLGYAVLVADLHGDGQRLTDPAETMSRLEALRADAATVRARAHAAYQVVLSNTGIKEQNIAAIGFCFGGTMALELARDGAVLGAVVGFHSGLVPLAEPAKQKLSAPVLVCIGADDPSIPAAVRTAFETEMTMSKSDWTIELYGHTIHSFTDVNADKMGRPEFARYSAQADAASWSAMLNLFNRTIDII